MWTEDLKKGGNALIVNWKPVFARRQDINYSG